METHTRLLQVVDLQLKIKEAEDINLLLSGVEDEDDIPFWAVLWPSAVALAGYLREKCDFTGSSVLELGAGVGLAGMVAAIQGGAVTQTDYKPGALSLQENNAGMNGVTGVGHELADWRNFDFTRKFDWIIGSDILYEPLLHRYLKEIFFRCLVEAGSLILADPNREGGKIFMEELLAEGFRGNYEEIPIEFDGLVYRIKIWVLQKERRLE